MTKIIKWIKDHSYRERLENFQLTILLERKMILLKPKIIIGISSYCRHFFNISPQPKNLL